MRTLLVIPARYGSMRFPGKPLALLKGKAMLQRVWEIAQSVCATRPGCTAVVATEDPAEVPESEKIVRFCADHGMSVRTTPASCQSGSDRAWAVCEAMEEKPDVVVNLQGDNPLCPPSFVAGLVDTFAQFPDTHVATPFTPLSWEALDALREAKRETPFSGTTVIVSPSGHALWFSKNIIPAFRNEKQMRATLINSPVLRHVGLYAYRLSALRFFATSPKGHYEQLEQLEQLRFLENGIPIRMVEVAYPRGYGTMTSGIDDPRDMARAEELIATYGELLVSKLTIKN